MHRQLPYAFMILIIFLSGCSTTVPQEFEDWKYTDVGVLDAVDAPTAGADILAVYTRRSSSFSKSSDTQLRIDFLDLSSTPECDIYIAFDILPGGTSDINPSLTADIEWDYLLAIPAFFDIQVFDPQLKPILASGISVFRDPIQDTIIINIADHSFQDNYLPFNIQVLTTLPSEKSPADTSNSFATSDQPPKRAQALFAFWNTFPSFVPVQALRRWDGAHTGPRGNRHGLYNLLKAADENSIPLVLLDLKYPAALSALDYMGNLDWINELIARQTIVLPDPVPVLSYSKPMQFPDEILHEQITLMRSIDLDMGVPTSQAVFSPYAPFTIDGSTSPYRVVFLMQPLRSESENPFPEVQISSCAGQNIIPIKIITYPDPYYDQTDDEGLSLSLRQALANNAIKNTISTDIDQRFLLLGGELPNSSWGNPSEAQAAFDYINHHPWIHVLGANELGQSSSARNQSCGQSQSIETLEVSSDWIPLLENESSSEMVTFAIQVLIALTNPIYPDAPSLVGLRQNYLSQFDVLLEASRWAENPYALADCSLDLQKDGHPECILSSDRFFLVVNGQNGALEYVFFNQNGNIHQIIGPSSLLVTGLSTADTWDLSKNEAADPSVIPGAFWDEGEQYHIDQISNNQITLTSQNISKTYTLTPDGINIDLTGGTGSPYKIPFLFDAWRRFSQKWIENYGQVINLQENSFTWKFADGTHLTLEANQPTKIISYADSHEWMKQTENPDMDYPQGHLLPIPLILCEINNTISPLSINLVVH